MENTGKIKFDNYPLLFDGKLMGYDTETQGFDYLYEVLSYFVTTEIINGDREWKELGKLIDIGFHNYQNKIEFLKFVYNAFYPIHIEAVRYEPRHDKTSVVMLDLVTDYMINWLPEKMELREIKKDLIICEMYATLRPQSSPTPSPEAQKRNLINPYEMVRKQWEQILEPLELMGVSFDDNDDQTPPTSPDAEAIDFVKDLNPCTEFDELFGNDIEGKIKIWNYMIDLKMIDSSGAFSMGSRRSFIRSFVLIMKKNFKIPNQSDTKLTKIFRLKLLGNSARINNSVPADEQQIEDFLNEN